jgi:hypothetical protein
MGSGYRRASVGAVRMGSEVGMGRGKEAGASGEGYTYNWPRHRRCRGQFKGWFSNPFNWKAHHPPRALGSSTPQTTSRRCAGRWGGYSRDIVVTVHFSLNGIRMGVGIDGGKGVGEGR